MKKFAICTAVFFLLCITGESQQAPSQQAPSQQTQPQTAKPSPAVRNGQPVMTANLRSEVLPTASSRPAVALMLPVGTPIRVKLDQALDTHRTRAGDAFSARVSQAIMLNGAVMVPAGALLQGHVFRVSEPRRIKGRPMIQLKTESLLMPDGQSYAINASVVDTGRVNGTRVDDEGRIIGSTRHKRDNIDMGAGAGAGTVVGVIVAGTMGSLIGAGAGAGIATGYWLIKRHSTRLPEGTEIILELGRPLAMNTPR